MTVSEDLLESTARLVEIPSESLAEAAIADHVERLLAQSGHLAVTRVGDNVIARTDLGRPMRLILAGHLDTVPANGNATPRIHDDTLWGLGAADMKGSLAVFLDLAARVADPAVDLTYVFYVAEEIAAEHNGLRALFDSHPELLVGDAAILGEPTDAHIEAGCQGTMRVVVEFAGVRAHTARPWKGDNAIHRSAALIAAVAAADCRRPVIDGCEFREAMQVVAVHGGVAGNVVPDACSVTVNVRFAPDRSADDALAWFHHIADPTLDERDRVEVVDVAPGALPSLTHPLLSSLAGMARGIRSKLGWTDVARFAAAGVPACNFGAGDALVAHMADEHLERKSIEDVHAALLSLVTTDR